MRRKRNRGGRESASLANSLRTPEVSHLCALYERLERMLRRAEKLPTLLTMKEAAEHLHVSERKAYRNAENAANWRSYAGSP
jgi:ribonuclease D